jgi:hypothetical protein
MTIGYIQGLSVPNALIRPYKAAILFNSMPTLLNLQKSIENRVRNYYSPAAGSHGVVSADQPV